MKIVILNGSPRSEGNTRTLLKAFEKGAQTHIEDATIEFIDTSKINVKPCVACDACRKSKGICIHEDDTNTVITKVKEADVLIFGSPVYWWGISAQLKIVIDKFYAWGGSSYTMNQKKIGIITVGGSDTSNEQYRLISDQFKCICQFLKWDIMFDEAYSAYYIGDIQKNLEALKQSENLYQIFI